MDFKLIIFDVDGTLVKCKSGKQFRESANDWEWLPGRVEKCKQLRAQDIKLAIASNQAGVAFPLSRFTAGEIKVEIHKAAHEIGAELVSICYSTPNEKALPEYYNPNDPRRKLGPGMITEIREDLHCSPEDTLYVGDRDEDMGAAQAAGVAFQWADQFFEVPV